MLGKVSLSILVSPITFRYNRRNRNLHALMKNFQIWVEASEKVEQIEKDLICYTKYHDGITNHWYRVKILEISPQRILFQSIDFGSQFEHAKKPSKKESVFRKLCENGSRIPLFAFEVKLANVEIDHFEAKRKTAKKTLGEKYINEVFAMHVVREATKMLPKFVNLVRLGGENEDLAGVLKEVGVVKSEVNTSSQFLQGKDQIKGDYITYRPLPLSKCPLGQN